MNTKRNATIRLLYITAVAIATAAPGLQARAQEKAKDSGPAACLARLKKMTGDWYQKDPKTGKDHLVVRYRVTAGGTVVEETLMPGSTEEMTSMYYLDNGSLVMTHYCAIGNQPHLKATSDTTPSRMEFKCAGGGGNMKSENDMHIHHVVFTIPSDDRFTSVWSANKDGKQFGGEDKFEMHRKTK